MGISPGNMAWDMAWDMACVEFAEDSNLRLHAGVSTGRVLSDSHDRRPPLMAILADPTD